MRARLKQAKKKGRAYKEMSVLGKHMKCARNYYWFVSNNVNNGITVSKVHESKLEFYDRATNSYI